MDSAGGAEAPKAPPLNPPLHICAFRHVDNHILYTLAQQTICELVSRVYKGGVHCHLTRGGGLSDGMKKIQMVL